MEENLPLWQIIGKEYFEVVPIKDASGASSLAVLMLTSSTFKDATVASLKLSERLSPPCYFSIEDAPGASSNGVRENYYSLILL